MSTADVVVLYLFRDRHSEDVPEVGDSLSGTEPNNFVHRISDESRLLTDPLTKKKDLLVSDVESKRPKVKPLESFLSKYTRDVKVVVTTESFLPLLHRLTKSMKFHLQNWEDPISLRKAFNTFFGAFKIAVELNQKETKLSRHGKWVERISFGDFVFAMDGIERLGNVGVHEEGYSVLKSFFCTTVRETVTAVKHAFHLEDAVISGLCEDPLRYLSEFKAAIKMHKSRDCVAHPFTAGRQYEPAKLETHMALLEEAARDTLTEDWSTVLAVCVGMCKNEQTTRLVEEKSAIDSAEVGFLNLIFEDIEESSGSEEDDHGTEEEEGFGEQSAGEIGEGFGDQRTKGEGLGKARFSALLGKWKAME